MCLQKRMKKAGKAKQKKKKITALEGAWMPPKGRIYFSVQTGCLTISDCPGQDQTPTWAARAVSEKKELCLRTD